MVGVGVPQAQGKRKNSNLSAPREEHFKLLLPPCFSAGHKKRAGQVVRNDARFKKFYLTSGRGFVCPLPRGKRIEVSFQGPVSLLEA